MRGRRFSSWASRLAWNQHVAGVHTSKHSYTCTLPPRPPSCVPPASRAAGRPRALQPPPHGGLQPRSPGAFLAWKSKAARLHTSPTPSTCTVCSSTNASTAPAWASAVVVMSRKGQQGFVYQVHAPGGPGSLFDARGAVLHKQWLLRRRTRCPCAASTGRAELPASRIMRLALPRGPPAPCSGLRGRAPAPFLSSSHPRRLPTPLTHPAAPAARAPAHCGRLNQRSSGVSRMEESSSQNSRALYWNSAWNWPCTSRVCALCHGVGGRVGGQAGTSERGGGACSSCSVQPGNATSSGGRAGAAARWAAQLPKGGAATRGEGRGGLTAPASAAAGSACVPPPLQGREGRGGMAKGKSASGYTRAHQGDKLQT